MNNRLNFGIISIYCLVSCVVIIILILIYFMNKDGDTNINIKIGSDAPTFNLKDLDGRVLKNFPNDRYTLVNFWASWCKPCREEAAILNHYHQKYGDKLFVIAINSTNKDNLVSVVNFQKTYNVTYPILLDRSGEVSKLYKVTSLPTTYIVDDRGKIVEVLFGNLNSNELIDKIKNIVLSR